MKGHIYFLFYRKRLLYIGQSKDVKKRLYQHLLYHKISKVRIIECDIDKLKHYEKRLINYFKPLTNIAHNTKNKYGKAVRMPFKSQERKAHRSLMNETMRLLKIV